MVAKLTAKEFNSKIQRVFGRTLSLYGEYNGTKKPISVLCSKCKTVTTKSSQSGLFLTKGCSHCSGSVRINQTTYLQRLDGFPDRQLHLVGTVVNSRVPVEHVCLVCDGEFLLSPIRVSTSKGRCPSCNLKRAKTTKQYNEELKELGSTLRCVGEYVNQSIQVAHRCSTCSRKYLNTPQSALATKGKCKLCGFGANYSNMANDWLKAVSAASKLRFQTILDGQEFTIPDTNYKVDGYNKRLKVALEFYGDKFHGNVKLFDRDYPCHPFNPNLLTGDLYDQTKRRERVIRKKGFGLITLWENQWIRDPEKSVLQTVDKLNQMKEIYYGSHD